MQPPEGGVTVAMAEVEVTEETATEAGRPASGGGGEKARGGLHPHKLGRLSESAWGGVGAVQQLL